MNAQTLPVLVVDVLILLLVLAAHVLSVEKQHLMLLARAHFDFLPLLVLLKSPSITY